MLFSVWDETNHSLSWDEVERWATLLSVETVPVLYRGLFSMEALKEVINSLDLSKQEGFVIRNSRSFHFNDFSKKHW